MENDGDIEIVSVQILKKPPVAQQLLCVLRTLKFVDEKIPTKFEHFCDFVQKFFSFTIDNVALKNAWLTLNNCSKVVRRVNSFQPGEIVVIDSDNESNTTDHKDCQISVYVENNVSCKEEVEENLKIGNVKAVKTQKEPLNNADQSDIFNIIKKHFSSPGTESSRNSSSPSSSVCDRSFETSISDKKMNKLILKKLKKLKKDNGCQIEVTPRKKHKRKSKIDGVTDDKEFNETVVETKGRRSTGSTRKKKKSISKESEEEEAERLRMDLFISKLVEISLPSAVTESKRRRTL